MIKSDFSTRMPDQPGRVHFVGIGGAGMSGIARLFVGAGHPVTGSDRSDSDAVVALRKLGVPVAIGHSEANVDGADTVVVTGAIAEDNPEYLAAGAAGLPVVHRARALAWLTASTRLVAVGGAAGKTTSTAMIVEALIALGQDPSFVNGGVIHSLGTSAASGSGELFVVEADESDGSFLLYDTAAALITNVDPDHLDHFGTEEAFFDAFVSFADRAREFVAISSDDAGARSITPRITGTRVVTFGEADDAEVRLHGLRAGDVAEFKISYRGSDYPVRLRVPGHHNAVNAAGAFAVLTGLGFDPRESLDAIATFGGTERRFQLRGEVHGVRVYDDFAHTPGKVRAALSAARDVVGKGRLIPIFQPHLFTRTRMLAQEFADVLEQLADFTIVVPVYGARQEPEPGVTGATITDRFSDPSTAVYLDDWDAAVRRAATEARAGDFVIPMGGGDIHLIIPSLLDALSDHALSDQALSDQALGDHPLSDHPLSDERGSG